MHASHDKLPNDEQATFVKPGSPGAAIAGDASTGQEAIHEADRDVPVEWNEGDVILDTYEVKVELGRGSFGTVHKVHHRGWNIDMAVKSALAHVSEEEITREAEVWMELGLHPNIVSCYFVRNLGGIPRIFVEYVEGGTLHEWLHRKRTVGEHGKHGDTQESRKPTRAQKLSAAIEICRGMQHAHTFEWTHQSGAKQVGLIHHDLKPQNILMTADGVPRVTDFGLVGFGSESSGQGSLQMAATGEGDASVAKSVRDADGLIGTPAYAAPEQWGGRGDIGKPADIYAFGVILYELFCGRRPFGLSDDLKHAMPELMQAEYERMHCSSVPLDPGSLTQDLDQELATLILQCLNKEPADRPADFGRVKDRLKDTYARLEGEDYDDLRPEPKAPDLLADSLNNRALSYLEMGQPERAETLWNDSLRADPDHLDATYNRLLSHWRTGRITDEAVVERLTSAIAINKHAWPMLAVVHIERGDCEGASAALASASGSDVLTKVARAAVAQPDETSAGWQKCAATLGGHTANITAVAITADGRIAISGGDDRDIRVWDLEHERQSHACAGHRAPITALAITRDGRHVASSSKDGDLRIWDMQPARCRGALTDTESAPYGVECLQFLDGDRDLIAACSDGHLRLWAIQDGRLVRRLEGHRGRCNCVAVSPNGRIVASGGTDLIVRVWDVRTGALMCELPGHATYINGLAFVGSSERLASASGTIKKQDTDIRLWDTYRAHQVGTLSGHSGGLNHVVSSDDGHVLLSCSGWGLIMNEESCIRMWQPHGRRCLRTFPGHGGATRGLAMTPDGARAVSAGDDKKVRSWNLSRPWFAAPFVVSRPADTLEASARDRDVQRQLDAARGRLAGGQVADARDLIRRVRCTEGLERHPEALQTWWAMLKRSYRSKLTGAWCSKTMRIQPAGPVMYAALLGDSGHAVALTAEGVVQRLDFARGEITTLEVGTHERLVRAHVSHSGRVLAVLTENGTLLSVALDATSISTRFGDQDRSVGWLCVTPDDTQVVTAHRDGAVRTWDRTSGSIQAEFRGITGAKYAYSLSRDGRFLVGASRSQTMALWDRLTGATLRSWRGKSAESIAVSPDGSLALTGEINGTVYLWDLAAGAYLGPLGGHRGAAWCVAVSPDSQLAASGGADGVVQVWDLTSCRRQANLAGSHVNAVRSLAWSRDSRYLLSTDEAGLACLWELDWECGDAPASTDWERRLVPLLRPFLDPPGSPSPAQPSLSDTFWAAIRVELGDIGLGWLSRADLTEPLARAATVCQSKQQPPHPVRELATILKDRLQEIETRGARVWALRCPKCRQRAFVKEPPAAETRFRCGGCSSVATVQGAVEEFLAATCRCGVTTMCSDITDPVICQKCGNAMFVVPEESSGTARTPPGAQRVRGAPEPSSTGTAQEYRSGNPPGVLSEPAESKACQSCGKRVPESVEYCLYCGARTPERATAVTTPAQEAPAGAPDPGVDPEIAELARKLVPEKKRKPGFLDRLQRMAEEAQDRKKRPGQGDPT